jgi:DNA polymerase-3 subunit delta'
MTQLIGHQEQVAAFMAAFTTGRPHHAWLLSGQRGLGKALFAREAAIWLLNGAVPGSGFGVPPDSEAARLMAAGSHLDFRLLERTPNKAGKLRNEIVIGQIVAAAARIPVGHADAGAAPGGVDRCSRRHESQHCQCLAEKP